MKILDAASHYRDVLKNHGSRVSGQIESAHKYAKQAIQPHLDRLYRDVNTRQVQGRDTPLAWLHSFGGLERIQQAVTSHIQQFVDQAKTATEQMIQWASSLGTQAAQTFLHIVSRFSMPIPIPSSVAKMTVKAASSLSNLFDGIALSAAKGVKEALERGISLGTKVTAIAKEVTQALEEPRWRALTIVDTELFRMFNAAATAIFGESAKLVHYMWICQLAPHSCATCVALHGTIHDMSEDLHDHPNGSCIKIPWMEGMEPIQTGVEWLKEQDEAMQRAILGSKVAYDLYASGRASLTDFVGVNHHHTYGDSVYQRSARELASSKI